MALPIIGDENSVTFTDPVSPTKTPYRWWAERGLIHWECLRTGNYGTVSVRHTLQRLQGLTEMIANSRRHGGFRNDEIRAYQDYVDRMIVVCETARDQGMPDNAAHSRQKGQEWKAKKHSRCVVVPGVASKTVW